MGRSLQAVVQMWRPPLQRHGIATTRSALIYSVVAMSEPALTSYLARSMTEKIVHLWLELYARYPRRTVVGSVILLVVLVTGVAAGIRQDRIDQERRRLEASSYQTQAEQLARVEASLLSLSAFVNEQQHKLRESQDVIAALQAEQQRPRPVVEADRRTVQAILQLQQEQTRKGAVRERWIGFGLGILASVIASVLYGIASVFVRRRASLAPGTRV